MRFILLFFLLFCSISAFAKEPIRIIEGIVIEVSDGDKIQVKDSLGKTFKIRLYGIDAPEVEKRKDKTGQVIRQGQPFGKEAFQALNSKVLRKHVKVEIMEIGQYKLLVSIIRLDERNINQEMLAEGFAWAYPQFLSRDVAPAYIQAEAQAKSKKLGLWQQSSPQSPWEFRRLLSPSKGKIERI